MGLKYKPSTFLSSSVSRAGVGTAMLKVFSMHCRTEQVIVSVGGRVLAGGLGAPEYGMGEEALGIAWNLRCGCDLVASKIQVCVWTRIRATPVCMRIRTFRCTLPSSVCWKDRGAMSSPRALILVSARNQALRGVAEPRAGAGWGPDDPGTSCASREGVRARNMRGRGTGRGRD